jgi:hypothetical protein
MIVMLSDGKTGGFQKPGFTTLVNKELNSKKPKKPGFLCKQVNSQQADYPKWLNTTFRLREKPGFSRLIHDSHAE